MSSYYVPGTLSGTKGLEVIKLMRFCPHGTDILNELGIIG